PKVPELLSPDILPPAMGRRGFEQALAEATGGLVQPYDLRRTFANWMETAGILRTRRKAYMGHRPSDVTDGYEKHNVTPFLTADAALLRNYLVSAIVGPCWPKDSPPEATPKISAVTRFATPSINAPSRNRTENLLIKSQSGDVGSAV